MANIEPPSELECIGEGFYIEAHICRPKKRKDGESNATIVSDTLPFIEYDLHRQLLYKLRIQVCYIKFFRLFEKGMNAIFGLTIQLAIGSGVMICVASGTATVLLF